MAKNGQEALSLCGNKKIDIVLTDYDMPVMNGLDMIQVIRKNNKKIPIIFVTGIEDSDVIIEALHLQVTNFLKKPIDVESLLEVMDNTVKIIIADQTIEKENTFKLQQLQERDAYNTYQEDLGFLKELSILRNDFYYQRIGMEYNCLIDFIYMPLDTLSGDAYSARKLGDNHYFYLIVDGMGKGISASFTSILITAFINYKIDKMIVGKHGFDLGYLIEEAAKYIKPILLDEEMLAISFIEIDMIASTLNYALFSMPPLLIQKYNGSVEKIISNNPPLSEYSEKFEINSYNVNDVTKYLFYSDGLNESEINEGKGIYSECIQDDFRASLTREDFKNKILEKIHVQEDDITCIFINRLDCKNNLLFEKEINSSMANVEKAQEWYEEIFETFTTDEVLLSKATLTFTEMILNAHEHGNMGIDSLKKHKMISDGSYWDVLEVLELERCLLKKIKISIYKVIYHDNQEYIVTNIKDDGAGFDTQILTKIFRNREQFNGKGVFISRKSSYGIYYNNIGNDVTFIHKL